MKITYRIISEIFLLISPLIVLYRILKGKESIRRFPERYAFNSNKRVKGNLIWFHCSSVGELLSIIPIIEKMEKNNKINQILITTTTLSSSIIFNNLNLEKTVHQFFPIDNKLIINKFLKYWKPTILFLCESEIWPNLIDSINKNKVKLVLINARITLKSFNRWKQIKNFSNSIFDKFNLCLAQNKKTYKRLSVLGAKNVCYLGNLKFSSRRHINKDKMKTRLLNFFKNKKILITAASTHFDEEKFILQNHLYFKKKFKEKRFISIIIPRHIERIGEIKKMIDKTSLKTHIHSNKRKVKSDTDIYLVDSYGELDKFYKISNLVFMGGSLINHGGQNPIEAAKLGCKIIYGPSFSNFTEIYKKLDNMKVSTMFKNYRQGTKIIENLIHKKHFVFDNKKLMKYGEKILSLTYLKIIKLI